MTAIRTPWWAWVWPMAARAILLAAPFVGGGGFFDYRRSNLNRHRLCRRLSRRGALGFLAVSVRFFPVAGGAGVDL
jgi:hypothetical protein